MAAMDYFNQSYPQDSIITKKIIEAGQDRAKLLRLYSEIDTNVKDSLKAGLKVGIANVLFDMKDYAYAEDILLKVLKKHPDTYSALSMMSALKRNTDKFDEGLKYCDRMLQFNKEDVYAISQKARIELKRKHDQDARKYADQAMEIAPDNDSALEAKAMVDYFAGKRKMPCKVLPLYSAMSLSAVTVLYPIAWCIKN
jgi:tetratricopeptide (TPR) repeat protein